MSSLTRKRTRASDNVIDYSDPFAIGHVLYELDWGKYGSATKDIEALIARKIQCLGPLMQMHSNKLKPSVESESNQDNNLKVPPPLGRNGIIDLDEEVVNNPPAAAQPVLIIDSDEEDEKDPPPSYPFEEIFLPKPVEQFLAGEMGVCWTIYL